MQARGRGGGRERERRWLGPGEEAWPGLRGRPGPGTAGGAGSVGRQPCPATALPLGLLARAAFSLGASRACGLREAKPFPARGARLGRRRWPDTEPSGFISLRAMKCECIPVPPASGVRKSCCSEMQSDGGGNIYLVSCKMPTVSVFEIKHGKQMENIISVATG